MKATLITGASGGIGEAFARALAAEKHNLILVARSEKKLHELCDELMLKHQITAHYVAIDLTEPDADLSLFKETERHAFEIDWLINNAGFGSMGDFAKLELENELEMISLNVLALVALTHRYLPKMRERKSGTIINVSCGGFQPTRYGDLRRTKPCHSFPKRSPKKIARTESLVTALARDRRTRIFRVANAKPPDERMQTPEESSKGSQRRAARSLNVVRAGQLTARFSEHLCQTRSSRGPSAAFCARIE